jgi:hypothetical protein
MTLKAHMLALFSKLFRRKKSDGVRALKDLPIQFSEQASPYEVELASARLREAQALVHAFVGKLPETVDRAIITFCYDDGSQLSCEYGAGDFATAETLGRGKSSAPPMASGE